MSVPVFFAEDLSGDRVLLDGPEGHHAAVVRRLRVGETVDLVDGFGTRCTCTVVGTTRESLVLEVVTRVLEPPPAPRVTLVQALAKGDRGELAVELATEVGVDAVVPWAASRCVQQWHGERGDKALARWRSTAREAAKQSRRAWFPPVAAAVGLEEVCGLPGRLLVLHGQAPELLSAVALEGDVVLVVGPEGGLTDEELAALQDAGGVAVRLGPTVLRTSTAGAAAVAVVSARNGRW